MLLVILKKMLVLGIMECLLVFIKYILYIYRISSDVQKRIYPNNLGWKIS